MPRIFDLMFLKGLFDEEPSDVSEPVSDGEVIQNSQPIVVFMIPGIRSDGEWVRLFRKEMDKVRTEHPWSDAPIDIHVVRGESRLTTARLVTRFGLSTFRKQITEQISRVCNKNKYSSINLVCHSMGSSLLSEIIDDLDHKTGEKVKVDKIIFLGSICHVSKASDIFDKCNIFINDVGVRDILPCIAMTINPWRYSQVGRLGFNLAYVRDRYFDNDHYTCTELNHLNEYIIPILKNQPVIEPDIDSKSIKLTRHIYTQRAVWAAGAAGVLGVGGYGLFW